MQMRRVKPGSEWASMPETVRMSTPPCSAVVKEWQISYSEELLAS